MNLSYKISLMLLLGLALLLSGCSPEKKAVTVAHYGVLREIMMEQKIGPNADLRDFADQSNLYALGALEGLSGEILILEGRPLNSLASSGELVFDRTFDRKATLLVAAEVDAWQEITLELESAGLAELETSIREAAAQRSINTEEAFPFLLKGDFQTIDWHVINAAEAEAQNHEAYKKAGLSGKSENEEGQVLGFYSEKHEGIFTHHGSYLHMHFINSGETLMGHVDGLVVSGSVSLFLPDNQKQ
jgi:acetolactate decarboxylase